MDGIKDQYRIEQDKDVYSEDESGIYSEDYVRWLEGKLSKLHQPTVISSACDKCLGRGSHVIYDTCIECKKCNGNGTQTDL